MAIHVLQCSVSNIGHHIDYDLDTEMTWGQNVRVKGQI